MFETLTRTLTRRRADRELTRILRDADPRVREELFAIMQRAS